jgi:hypothetical protein
MMAILQSSGFTPLKPPADFTDAQSRLRLAKGLEKKDWHAIRHLQFGAGR